MLCDECEGIAECTNVTHQSFVSRVYLCEFILFGKCLWKSEYICNKNELKALHLKAIQELCNLTCNGISFAVSAIKRYFVCELP